MIDVGHDADARRCRARQKGKQQRKHHKIGKQDADIKQRDAAQQ